MPQSQEQFGHHEAIQQFHRASQLETLARTEAARHGGDVLIGLQLRVFKRCTAAAREAARAAKQAQDAGIDAGVVHLAATAARGMADAAEDALVVLRSLIKNVDPTFKPTEAPPARSINAPHGAGALTREAAARVDASFAAAELRGDAVTIEAAPSEEALEASRDRDTIETRLIFPAQQP